MTNGTSWGSARNICANDGAYLVIIDDAAEDSAIRAFMPDDAVSPYFWVGVTDAINEGEYITSLGAPATYLPWAASQPNGGPEDCVLLADVGGFWDWPCGQGPQYFACECAGP